DAPPLGLLYLELLVDEFVEYLLPRRRLVGRQLDELAALLDVQRGDGLAVDDHDHVLGDGRCRHRDKKDRGGHAPATCGEEFRHVWHCWPCCFAHRRMSDHLQPWTTVARVRRIAVRAMRALSLQPGDSR